MPLPSEITGVTPRSGSREGGTRITVTVDVTLTNYTDTDVKVLVGGKEKLFTRTIPLCSDSKRIIRHGFMKLVF